jgi:beta-lactamase superfamily II metal-dependent hydrolase
MLASHRHAVCVLAKGVIFWALVGILFASPGQAWVEIHCLDVGQGDATLIRSSSGQTLLFDGGENALGTTVISPYLGGLGISDLTYMVASHYHSDHIGGLDEVYAQIGVTERVYDRGWGFNTTSYQTYASSVAAKRSTISDGQVIDLGHGVTVTCLGLNGNGQVSSPFNNLERENDYCVALLVELGAFDFLVSGDLPGINSTEYTDIETSIAQELTDGLEVYRVNHHGSFSSSNNALLNLTRPEVAIISVGDGNAYGHPHQSVLNRIAAYGTFIYQTETGAGGTLPPADLLVVNGHIVITTDGFGEYFVNGDEWAMDEPDETGVPSAASFVLWGNYPNPFNPTTNILFNSRNGGSAQLTIYDLSGRCLCQRRFRAQSGPQSVSWNGWLDDARPAPTGIYLYRLETPDGQGHGRMTLIK